MPKKIEVKFSFERETKNTYRYVEQAEENAEQIGVLYIKKRALGPLPSPEILVTVEDMP